jgi:hypothetical protein
LVIALAAPIPVKRRAPRTEKGCTRCQQVKPLDDFGREPRHRDGRKSTCRACDRERYYERKAAKAASEGVALRPANLT